MAAAVGLLVAGCAVDLGTLQENRSAGASAINDAGVVVGWGETDNGPHAIRKLPDSPMVDLNSGPNAVSVAYGLNNAGVAVGASVEAEFAAVLWELDGTMVELGVGPDSAAFDINDSGTIVGKTGADAFVRSPSGEVTILFRGGASASADALGVNNEGVAVGRIHMPGGGDSPTVWSPPQYLGFSLPVEEGETGSAFDVNDAGDAVGWVGGESQYPVLWRAGSHERVQLPLGPYVTGVAMGINDAGQIVGSLQRAGSSGRVAVRWDSAAAAPVSLGGLGGGSSLAEDINEAGDAAGSADARERTPDGRHVGHAVTFPDDDCCGR